METLCKQGYVLLLDKEDYMDASSIPTCAERISLVNQTMYVYVDALELLTSKRVFHGGETGRWQGTSQYCQLYCQQKSRAVAVNAYHRALEVYSAQEQG